MAGQTYKVVRRSPGESSYRVIYQGKRLNELYRQHVKAQKRWPEDHILFADANRVALELLKKGRGRGTTYWMVPHSDLFDASGGAKRYLDIVPADGDPPTDDQTGSNIKLPPHAEPGAMAAANAKAIPVGTGASNRLHVTGERLVRHHVDGKNAKDANADDGSLGNVGQPSFRVSVTSFS